MAKIVKVAVTQPYLPKYRVPLFQSVHDELVQHGYDFRVFLGCGPAQQREIDVRGDSAIASWAETVPVKSARSSSGRNPLIFRRIPKDWSHSLLVTELQVANLNAWHARALNRPYITLGHGKEYILPKPRIAVALETELNKRSRHVCTYTEDGRSTVLKRTGLPPHRVSAFNNSTDTSSLSRLIAEVTSHDKDDFCSEHGIPKHAKIAFYVGALEPYKRIDILTEAFALLKTVDPSWWLVVAGDGSERAKLLDLQRRTESIVMLGHAEPSALAVPAAISKVLLNPGRVGLIAVDALAMKLPVVTTSGARHAPELDYLEHGKTLYITSPDAASFSSAWAKVEAPESFPEAPTIQEAAGNISRSIIEVLEGELPAR